MSKKNLRNRLSELFSDIETESVSLAEYLEQPQGWIWSCDQTGQYETCSPEIETLLGYSRDEVVGSHIYSFAVDKENGAAILRAIESKQQEAELQVNFISKSGRRISARLHLSIRAAPLGEKTDTHLTHGFQGFVNLQPQEINLSVELLHKPETRPLVQPLTDSDFEINQSGYLLDENTILPAQAPITHLGKESLSSGRLLKQPADADQQATMAIPLRIKDQSKGVLELIDDKPDREWNQDEEFVVNQVIDQLSLALENAQLFQETQENARQNEALYRASQKLSAAQSLQDILIAVVEGISIQSIQSAMLWEIVRESSEKVLRLGALWQKSETTSPMPLGTTLSESKFPAANYALTQEALFSKNIQVDSRVDEYTKKIFKDQNAFALILIPLWVSNRQIGVLMMVGDQPHKFTAREIQPNLSLAGQVAIVMENFRSYELANTAFLEARLRAQEMTKLFEVSQSLVNAPLSTEEIAGIVTEQFAKVLDFENCSLSLLEQSGAKPIMNVIRTYPTKKANSEPRAGERIELSHSPAVEWVINNLQPKTIHIDDKTLTTSDRTYLENHNSITKLIIPLAVKGLAIGIIELNQTDDRHLFDEDRLNLAMTLANAAAVSLENARLYEEQRQTSERLLEVDKLKTQFLANMSHELRTPLNSIIGFSRVILKGIDGPVTQMQEQDLNAIFNSGQHLLSLINNILDLSKIEAGKMELAIEELHLPEIINSVMSTAIGLTKEKPIELQKNIPPDLPSVKGDHTRIRQVLLNLVANAAKFTDEGFIRISAKEQVSDQGVQEVQVQVSDSGVGISPEDTEKLFKPFSQVDASPTRKTGGTGLGLSISSRLIEIHGGRIGVESQVGKGSMFFFTLPVSKPEAAPVVHEEKTNAEKIILAVDDNQQVIRLYERYLSDQGFKIIAQIDPKQAVESARELKPYAITLDIMMPEVNGWQVLQELKNDPETRNIPVLICSILQDEEKAYSLGAIDYLVKPILEEDLKEAIARLNGKEQNPSILLTADNPGDLEIVQTMLKGRDGYSLTSVTGNVEALSVIQSQRPDVVIICLGKSDADPLYLLEFIRSDADLRNIPIVLITDGTLSEKQYGRLNALSNRLLNSGTFTEAELISSLEQVIKRFYLVKATTNE